MLGIEKTAVEGKKVVVRCDFDVPVENGKITDKRRLVTTAKTLKVLLERKASLSLIGHLGRPEGKDLTNSLALIKAPLENLLGEEIKFSSELQETNFPITLFENLRFWPEEEANDLAFGKKLAALGEFYVNECFSACHRQHASVDLPTKTIPGFAGIDLEREVTELEKVLQKREKPLVAIIGGAKLETKLPAITNLAKVADKVLVGGKLVFEENKEGLPENVILASDDIDQKDIGPETLKTFANEIAKAKMVVWNGPMGKFEDEKYAVGTRKLAQIVANSSAYTIIGGGDTIAALDQIGLAEKINFISMGGGAMLEFLEGKKLPGLAALGYYG